MNKKQIFRGVATALITPFKNGEIDYDALGRLIEYQIANKVDALVIGGTTAEISTLSTQERYRLYAFAKEKIDGRTRLILGTGTNYTRATLSHSKFAEKIGCDGLLLVTPYYNKGTELGIEKHYLSIAESVDLPIIVYNVPSRTGVNLEISLLERLANHPNIIGIKEASDSADRLISLATLGDKLSLYAGNDSQIYPVLALGGKGVISVVSNILPKETKNICSSYFDNNPNSSLNIQLKLLPLIKALFIETNPAPIKYAMWLRGLCSAELRLPLCEPKDSTKREIEGALCLLKSPSEPDFSQSDSK